MGIRKSFDFPSGYTAYTCVSRRLHHWEQPYEKKKNILKKIFWEYKIKMRRKCKLRRNFLFRMFRESQGARFNKEVQPTLSLNLNSELTYLEMGNSEFSFQNGWIELVYSTLSRLTLTLTHAPTMKSHDQWSSEITIHHGNSSSQKDVHVFLSQCLTLIFNNCP